MQSRGTRYSETAKKYFQEIREAEESAYSAKKQNEAEIQVIFNRFEENIDNGLVGKGENQENDREVEALLKERNRLKSMLRKKDKCLE